MPRSVCRGYPACAHGPLIQQAHRQSGACGQSDRIWIEARLDAVGFDSDHVVEIRRENRL